jgi:hypothetical protein
MILTKYQFFHTNIMDLNTFHRNLSITIAALTSMSFPATSRAHALTTGNNIKGGDVAYSSKPRGISSNSDIEVPGLDLVEIAKMKIAIVNSDEERLRVILENGAVGNYSEYFKSLKNGSIGDVDRFNSITESIIRKIFVQLDLAIEEVNRVEVYFQREAKFSFSESKKRVLRNSMIDAIYESRLKLLEDYINSTRKNLGSIQEDFQKAKNEFPGVDEESILCTLIFKKLTGFSQSATMEFLRIDESSINLASRRRVLFLSSTGKKTSFSDAISKSLMRSTQRLLPSIPQREVSILIEDTILAAIEYDLSLSSISSIVDIESSKLSQNVQFKASQNKESATLDFNSILLEVAQEVFDRSNSLLLARREGFDFRVKAVYESLESDPALVAKLEQILITSEVASRMMRHIKSIEKMKPEHRLWHQLPEITPTYQDFFSYLYGK